MDSVGSSLINDYRQIFVEKTKLLDAATFDHVVQIAKHSNQALEPLLIEKAFISPNQYLQLAEEYFKLPSTPLNISEINRQALHFVHESVATKELLIPFDFDEHTIKVAVAHPQEADVNSFLIMTGKNIKVYVTTEQALRRALVLFDSTIDDELAKLVNPEEGSTAHLSIDKLAISIIETAVLYGASDVHIEPFEDTVIIRLRTDGILKQVAALPTNFTKALAAYFKVKSNLRLDETRTPQDGRINYSIKGQEVNVRISLVPSLWGEKVVLRILPKEHLLLDLSSLGLIKEDLDIVRRGIKRPYGLILVCGPTGSGKTTSLYAFMQEIGLDKIDVVNISTIEDPIEYTIPRATQIQVNPNIELSFADGLRSLLRQDPDIIMVGEIRDEETANIAIRTALVGRLILSSLHTNNAAGVVPRLLDMKVEPYLIASTLSLVVAQRLARKLCNFCRVSYEVDEKLIKSMSKFHNIEESLKILNKMGYISHTTYKGLRFFKAKGCEHCNNTGYQGRTGLFELLEVTDEIREEIKAQADAMTIQKLAVKNNMKTMFQDGLIKLTLGIIDVDELLRVAYE